MCICGCGGCKCVHVGVGDASVCEGVLTLRCVCTESKPQCISATLRDTIGIVGFLQSSSGEGGRQGRKGG